MTTDFYAMLPEGVRKALEQANPASLTAAGAGFVSFNGSTAYYTAQEREAMSELRAKGATRNELEVVHELKAVLDGRLL